MANFISDRVRKAICLFMCVIATISVVTDIINSNAYAATNYGNTIGTEVALNSPLVNDSVTKEGFNTWELETFCIFLSNFCVPFVDSIESAFVADGTGTNGAGINALVFGAGGDIQAESILKRMTTFALNASNNLVPLKVEFNYYRKNGEVLETYRYDDISRNNNNNLTGMQENIDEIALFSEVVDSETKYIDDESQDEDKNNSLPDTVITDIPTQPAQGTQEGSDVNIGDGSNAVDDDVYQSASSDITGTTIGSKARQATLADLFVQIDSFMYGGQDGNGVYPNDISSAGSEISWQSGDIMNRWNYPWMRVASYFCGDTDSNTTMLVPIEAMLPKFYAVKTLSDNNGQLAFDMADGWDCQIFNVCLNYALKKNGGEFENNVKDIMKVAKSVTLSIDTTGNIVGNVSGKNIVIIPACMNRHLTSGKSAINLVTAPIMNDYLDKEPSYIAGALSNSSDFYNNSTTLWQNVGANVIGSVGGAAAGALTILIPGVGFLGAAGVGVVAALFGAKNAESNFKKWNQKGYAAIGTGLDTCNLDVNGVKDYCDGKIIIYNTSDSEMNNGIFSIDKVKEFATRNQVDLTRNLMITVVGSGTKNLFETQRDRENIIYKRDVREFGTNDFDAEYVTRSAQLASNIWANKVGNSFDEVNISIVTNKKIGSDQETAAIINTNNVAYCTNTQQSAPYEYEDDRRTDLIKAAMHYTLAYMNNKISPNLRDDLSIASADTPETYRTILSQVNSPDGFGIKMLTTDGVYSLSSRLRNAAQHMFAYTKYHMIKYKKNGDAVTMLEETKNTHPAALFGWGDDSNTEGTYGIEGFMFDNLGYGISVVATANAEMTNAKNYLCLAEGTNFASYSTWVYLTYLKFYGLIGSKSDKTVFNVPLMNLIGNGVSTGNSDELYAEIFGDEAVTEEEKQQRVQEYTYYMLTPSEKGVDYRNQLMVSGVRKFLATEYNNICYGGNTDNTFEKATNKGSSGFLQMVGYNENFLTRWVVENWNRVLVIAVLAFAVVIILVGAITGKKFMWFVVNCVIAVVMLVLLPTSGETTPYICDKLVQSMFESGQRYWSISEAIENNYLETAVSDEEDDILMFMNMINITQTTKTLMLKHDISRKVIDQIGVDYSEIMQLQSVRWMLPELIGQISADKKEDINNYVYTTVQDTREQMKNVYIYYKSEMTDLDNFNNRGVLMRGTKPDIDTLANNDRYNEGCIKSNIWDGYKTVTYKPYSSISLYDNLRSNSDHLIYGYLAELAYRPSSNVTGGKKYKLPSIITGNGTYSEKVWESYMNKIDEQSISGTDADVLHKFNETMIGYISHYDKDTAAGIPQCFGYLYTTESLIPYFYLTVKDTFSYLNQSGLVNGIDGYVRSDTLTLDSLANKLQGNIDNETGVRTGIEMFVGTSGLTRDVLDLETLFTNYIPYYYQMQLTAGGSKMNSGLSRGTLGDYGYSIYSETPSAWMYRCNWVTKLVEASQYSTTKRIKGYASYKLGDNGTLVPEGEKIEYNVENTLFPHSYYYGSTENGIPVCGGDNVGGNISLNMYRPMVFSEAQMGYLGLSESDLSNVELACVETNRKIVEQWTTLLNYVYTDGITRNIIEEQMAMEAAMVFFSEIQPDNYISSEMALYPTSLDLRAVNFDSVMKLLVISDNNNPASLKQDAIYTIMDDSGIIGGLLALASAGICAVLVPGVRTFVLGALFYLAIFSCAFNMLSTAKRKGKAVSGALMSNILLMIVTVAYYGVYWLFITRSGSDEILTTDVINAGTSMVMWKLLAVFVASLAYIVFLIYFAYKMACSFRDMGYSLMKQYVSSVTNGISNLVTNITNGFSNLGSSSNTSEMSGDATRKKREELNRRSSTGSESVNSTQYGNSEVRISNKNTEAVPVYMTNKTDDATFVEDAENEIYDSGYVEGEDDYNMETPEYPDNAHNTAGVGNKE